MKNVSPDYLKTKISVEFQTNKSGGKILRNKNLTCNKKYLHSGMNRLTSPQCRKLYVRKLQEILTDLVNMCKYFVMTVVIKAQHPLESQLSVGTIGNKMGGFRTQKGEHINTAEKFYIFRETKRVTKSAINTRNSPTTYSRSRYTMDQTMTTVTLKLVQCSFGLCAVRTQPCYIRKHYPEIT
jgi:hypothetical protein